MLENNDKNNMGFKPEDFEEDDDLNMLLGNDLDEDLDREMDNAESEFEDTTSDTEQEEEMPEDENNIHNDAESNSDERMNFEQPDNDELGSGFSSDESYEYVNE